eukprot:GHVQ01020656.1.p1 GENE.GHVQ01020656.1~~GHVQ01020656.1.p1  ORF type:complete len:309 (+),score=23.49 GHVQ01020656.1:61-987(+)
MRRPVSAHVYMVHANLNSPCSPTMNAPVVCSSVSLTSDSALSSTCLASSQSPASFVLSKPRLSTNHMPVRSPPSCVYCLSDIPAKAALRRPSTFEPICKACFFATFEEQVHQTIIRHRLFKHGDKVAIGVSGGKDSTVLAHVLCLLNRRYNYGLDLFLLAVDEGIRGYRDDSLETVFRNEKQYRIPLKVVSYKQLYGWSMDEIVEAVGRKNNCTFCGVFRRQALDRGCALLGVDVLCTGHNADDCAETIVMNILRGDMARLRRCAEIVTNDRTAEDVCSTDELSIVEKQYQDTRSCGDCDDDTTHVPR